MIACSREPLPAPAPMRSPRSAPSQPEAVAEKNTPERPPPDDGRTRTSEQVLTEFLAAANRRDLQAVKKLARHLCAGWACVDFVEELHDDRAERSGELRERHDRAWTKVDFVESDGSIRQSRWILLKHGTDGWRVWHVDREGERADFSSAPALDQDRPEDTVTEWLNALKARKVHTVEDLYVAESRELMDEGVLKQLLDEDLVPKTWKIVSVKVDGSTAKVSAHTTFRSVVEPREKAVDLQLELVLVDGRWWIRDAKRIG
jgi:hypothetical protein